MPGLVPLYGLKTFEDFAMIGMEYCPNGSLESIVINRKGKKMNEEVLKSVYIDYKIMCLSNFDRNE